MVEEIGIIREKNGRYYINDYIISTYVNNNNVFVHLRTDENPLKIKNLIGLVASFSVPQVVFTKKKAFLRRIYNKKK